MFFRFWAFCRLGEIWDDFCSQNDTQKAQKSSKSEKKRCWKRVVFLHRFFWLWSDFRLQKQVILDPYLGLFRGPKMTKSHFFVIFASALVLKRFWVDFRCKRGSQIHKTHIPSAFLASSKSFFFLRFTHDPFYLDGMSGAPFWFVTFWKLWNGFVDAVSFLGIELGACLRHRFWSKTKASCFKKICTWG